MTLSIRIAVSLLIVGAMFVFSTTALQAFWYAPETELPEPPQGVLEPVGALPSLLRIPGLNIESEVQHVGVNTEGNMATPSNFRDVAWYKYGSIPGERGSAVIAGHVDNGLGLSGVFKNLHKMEVGERIEVAYDDGSVREFEVTAVRTYPYLEVPTDILFNPAGSPRLNLITCIGDWVRSDRTYDQRLVVFTRLVE